MPRLCKLEKKYKKKSTASEPGIEPIQKLTAKPVGKPTAADAGNPDPARRCAGHHHQKRPEACRGRCHRVHTSPDLGEKAVVDAVRPTAVIIG